MGQESLAFMQPTPGAGIGDQEMFGFVVRALGYGGLAFEDDKPDTLAEGVAALEKVLRKWFEEEGIDLK